MALAGSTDQHGVSLQETFRWSLPRTEAGVGYSRHRGNETDIEFLRCHEIFREQQQTSRGKRQEVRTTKKLWSSYEISGGLQRTCRRGLSKTFRAKRCGEGVKGRRKLSESSRHYPVTQQSFR